MSQHILNSALSLSSISACSRAQRDPVFAPVPMWTQVTGDLAEGTYAILTDRSDDLWRENWILAQLKGGGTTQRNAYARAGRLELAWDMEPEAQQWTVARVPGGVTIQNLRTGQYLDLSRASQSAVPTSPDPVPLTILPQPGGKTYAITRENLALACDGKAFRVDAAPSSLRLFRLETGTPRLVPETLPPGQTKGQPFPSGTGGSRLFRIPAIITLSDGTLVAAIDARWSAMPDGFNTETILSISKDCGKTWDFQFVNYFNDATNVNNERSSAFLDPLLIRDRQDTIYLITDLYPNGKYIGSTDDATGFEDIGGTRRMVLYDFPEKHTSSNFTHCLGDPQPDGFTPVYERSTPAVPVAYLDPFFMLHDAQKQPLYCRQLGSYDMVRQNVFFKNAWLHVRNACYLCLRKSTDKGVTWSHPVLLNAQVRKTAGTCRFYGMGPGAGLCLDDGMLVAPAYTHPVERASFIYSTDRGATWKRSQDATTDCWSSESALVQIAPGRIRQIHRNGSSTLLYTDHLWNGQRWIPQKPVDTGVVKTIRNQLSAIRYSQLMDGKPAILVATAATGTTRRERGTIYTFLLDDDLTMTLAHTYLFTPGSCDYTSLTELKDGSIGLLFEERTAYPRFLRLPIRLLAPGSPADDR